MHATIIIADEAGALAPVTLLGQNLEIAADTAQGMLTDRLANPKFHGQANADSGVAPGWKPGFSYNNPGFTYSLTPGLFLSGTQSQHMRNYSGRGGSGLFQSQRKVRAGERLEVSLWARAQYQPATLVVGVRPEINSRPIYAAAEMTVAPTYWQEYTATLEMPVDDDEAVFFCLLNNEGIVWIDQIHLRPAEAGTVRSDLLEAIGTLQVPVLRFPGGCITTAYHWQYGTGPMHLRPEMHDPVFKWTVNYDFGTDEYLALCLAQGIMPHITVNTSTGTPEEAAEWAGYCADWFRTRGIEPPPAYWQIGNEQYGFWELGNMTGEEYVEVLRAFVPGIRAAYPGARIIALGTETSDRMRPGEVVPLRAPVLEQAADLLDVLSIQCYANGWHDDPLERYQLLLRNGMGQVQQIAAVAEDADRYGKTAAVTEWNLFTTAAHYDDKGFYEPYDTLHCLYNATMLHQYVRMAPGLELANFYHLVNPMGIFVSRSPEIEETRLADLFRLYRPAFPGTVYPVSVEGPALTDDLPALDAACLKNAGGSWLFLINRHSHASITIPDLPNNAEVSLLVGTTLDGDMQMSNGKITAGCLTLPPLAVARLHW